MGVSTSRLGASRSIASRSIASRSIASHWGGLAIVFLLVLGPGPGARADFDAGLAAYRAGDYAGALAEWGPAARAGEASAQYGIGLMFATGLGFTRDPTEALRWLEKAAAQGEARAQYRLGMAHLQGEGAAPDRAPAARWLRAAAPHGEAAAEGMADFFERCQAEPDYWLRVSEASVGRVKARYTWEL